MTVARRSVERGAIIAVAICAIASAPSGAGAETRPAAKELLVQLTAPLTIRAGEPVELLFTLRNVGSATVYVAVQPIVASISADSAPWLPLDLSRSSGMLWIGQKPLNRARMQSELRRLGRADSSFPTAVAVHPRKTATLRILLDGRQTSQLSRPGKYSAIVRTPIYRTAPPLCCVAGDVAPVAVLPFGWAVYDAALPGIMPTADYEVQSTPAYFDVVS
jgi:hypothetical protein